VIPRWILGAACKRGDYDNAIAIRGVHQRLCDRPTALGAGRRQEKHWHIGKLTANFPLVRPKFTNHLLIEIIQFRHSPSMKSGIPYSYTLLTAVAAIPQRPRRSYFTGASPQGLFLRQA
jgi:hypothetical protein